MGRFLIVSKADKLEEYIQISKEYDVSFEINDFFDPEILNDKAKLETVKETYIKQGIPKHSTMHGAFFDIAIFSKDTKIREISELRMEQSMQIAKELGVEGVVFHTNYNPGIPGEQYKEYLMDTTSEFLEKLLKRYPKIQIYMENMFEIQPDVLKGISRRLENHTNYGVCLDWAHVNVYGEREADWVESLKDYIKHIHINDNDLVTDLHLPVGSGKINWEQFFDYYNKYFQPCSVLIETNEPCNQRKSLEYIRKKFHGV